MRQQANAALGWSFAFLDAFDLGPLALDAIDGAIAEMDRDDGDPDLEPSLADVAHFAIGITASVLDAEDDSEEDEGTALESFGRGFVRAGADDAEEDDEPERDDEPGSDDGEDIGHHASQFRPVPLTQAERAEVVVMAALAAQVRRTMHV